MHETITACKKCGEAKPLADFYAKDKTCKLCRREMVRANRKAKIEYYREYDRKRSDNPDRVEARKEYSKTEAHRISHQKANRRYKDRYPVKTIARQTVSNAIRDGKLDRLPCFVCGDANSEAHHSDYSAPLAVTWLCDTHHKEVHKMAREFLRQTAAMIAA